MHSIWKEVTLGDAAAIFSSGVDKHLIPGEVGVRLCNYLDVYRNRRLTKGMEFSKGSARPAEIARFSLRKGDLVITKDSETPDDIGIPALVADDLDRVICGYHLALIRPRSDVMLPEFLLHFLQSDSTKRHFLRTAAGLTRFGLGSRAISSLPIPAPPLGEQVAIAQLLDALDCVLEHSRIALATAQHVLRGLQQTAFEFAHSKEPRKRTDFGVIPRSWDAIKGREAFVIVTGGCSSADSLRLPAGGKTPDAWFMKVDDFNLSTNRREITQTKLGFLASENAIFKIHPPGTIVIAKRGAAILKNRVRSSRVPLALDPNLMGLHALPGMCPDFLRCQLQWRNLSRYVESSGVPQLNNKDLYPRYFLRAPEGQQREIVEMISAAEAYEDRLAARCEAYRVLKQSLMDDALTGRIRVEGSEELAAA